MGVVVQDRSIPVINAWSISRCTVSLDVHCLISLKRCKSTAGYINSSPVSIRLISCKIASVCLAGAVNVNTPSACLWGVSADIAAAKITRAGRTYRDTAALPGSAVGTNWYIWKWDCSVYLKSSTVYRCSIVFLYFLHSKSLLHFSRWLLPHMWRQYWKKSLRLS